MRNQWLIFDKCLDTTSYNSVLLFIPTFVPEPETEMRTKTEGDSLRSANLDPAAMPMRSSFEKAYDQTKEQIY